MRGPIKLDERRVSAPRMFAVRTRRPQPFLRPFVRAYVHRTTPSAVPLGSVEPFVARSAGTLDFLFDSLYEIPTLDGTTRDICMPTALRHSRRIDQPCSPKLYHQPAPTALPIRRA